MKTLTLNIEAPHNVPNPVSLAKKIDAATSKLNVASVVLIGANVREDGFGSATILFVLEDQKSAKADK